MLVISVCIEEGLRPYIIHAKRASHSARQPRRLFVLPAKPASLSFRDVGVCSSYACVTRPCTNTYLTRPVPRSTASASLSLCWSGGRVLAVCLSLSTSFLPSLFPSYPRIKKTQNKIFPEIHHNQYYPVHNHAPGFWPALIPQRICIYGGRGPARDWERADPDFSHLPSKQTVRRVYCTSSSMSDICYEVCCQTALHLDYIITHSEVDCSLKADNLQIGIYIQVTTRTASATPVFISRCSRST